ncbi:solute carrier family 45 member 4-like [Watersipora subatra]|uniref:solute carrier family 45 member 4-like n=1 Tax=Watersipora subatra TaxID=2589382 RepID=UPI00355AF6C1
MTRGALSSTLQALASVEKKLADVYPLSESQMTLSWSNRVKRIFRMSLIGAAVGGIELCYSAETAFVSPLLLQLGVPVYLMSLCWMASPLLGFFLVPILGSASDTCTSSLGRRRPFIILYSTGIVVGLVLVPWGKNIGNLLGDEEDISFGNLTNFTFANDSYFIMDSNNHNHPAGTFFTILGVVLLDFCCDGCQTPCRTLMIDQTSVGDQSQGLATFTIIAGIGGAVGYTVGGIKWSKHLLEFPLDPRFSTHVHVVFGVVLLIFVIGSLLTILSVREQSIGTQYQSHKYKRMYMLDEMCAMEGLSPLTSSKSADALLKSSFGLSADEANKATNLSQSKSENAIDKGQPLLVADEEFNTATMTNSSCHSRSSQSRASDWSSGMEEDLQVGQVGMRVFLKSIVFMPKHMWILCLCNFFCWMSLVTYSLYFTDYVGQSIYKGKPESLLGTNERAAYDEGVRMGSLAMVLYSLSCALYSFAIVKLIDRFGTKMVYVLGQLVYSVGMAILAVTGHIVAAFISSLSAGFMYATLFTLPYLLIARYHSNTEFLQLHAGSNAKLRGLGTDIAIVSSMVFAGQFTLSLFIGALLHAASTTTVIPVTASVFSLCGAITALKVEYLSE